MRSKVLIFIVAIAFSSVFNACNNKKTSGEDQNSGDTTALKGQKREGPFAAMKFEETEFDFGEVKEGEVVKHIFRFTNDGDAPLVINHAESTCGCTVPKWPTEPIPVGEGGSIEVEYNTQGKGVGETSKPVTITANTEKGTETLMIKGRLNKAE